MQYAVCNLTLPHYLIHEKTSRIFFAPFSPKRMSTNCHKPTQLNPKLGRPYFPKKTTNHKTTTETVRHCFSAPTQPNSTKFRMQPCFNPTRRFMPKNGHPYTAPPSPKKIKKSNKKLPKFLKFDFDPILKKNIVQLKFFSGQNNNQFCSTPTKFNTKQKTIQSVVAQLPKNKLWLEILGFSAVSAVVLCAILQPP